MMQHDNFQEISSSELLQAIGWQAQYRLITGWGKLITYKPELRQAEHLIKGCEVSAWMAHEVCKGQHRFEFDSDSRVINGLAAWVLTLIDNKTHDELLQVNISQLLLTAGLDKHLTPSRNNGLRAIVLRAYTLAKLEINFNHKRELNSPWLATE